MTKTIDTAEFWTAIDSLIAQSEIVIDRPKGSTHPRYNFIYPLDYGYLKDTASPDGGGIDVWRGSSNIKCDAIICTVDLVKRDSETKLLIGCTEDEKAIALAAHNDSEHMKGVMIRRDSFCRAATPRHDFDIRPIDAETRPLVTAFIDEHWFGTDMLIRGEVIDMTSVDGFTLLENGALTGVVTYIVRGGVCEITSFDSTIEGRGVGSVLIDAVVAHARKLGCKLLQLLTTNDNLNAIGFYQKHGFELVGVNLGAIDREREQKPSIPLIGQNGIPIHHEVEFAMMLTNDRKDNIHDNQHI